MQKKEKSIGRVLVTSTITIIITVILFFFTQQTTDYLKRKELQEMQDNIAIVNSCVSLVQNLETSFKSYVETGESEFANTANSCNEAINNIIEFHPEVFQTADQVILFSRSVSQIAFALNTLLHDQLYNNLDKSESFSTIQLADTGFQFLTKATHSLLVEYLSYTSDKIKKIVSKYVIIINIQNIAFSIFISIFLFNFLSVYKSTRKGFSFIQEAALNLTEDKWEFDNLPESKYSEIDIASKAFNKMKKSLRMNMDALQEKIELQARLSEKTLESERQKRIIQESKYKLLQVQINPHFLFNTLNMITNSVRSGEDNEHAAEMLIATSKLLRSSLEINEKSIPLEQELRLLDSYITIQRARTEGRISFLFEIEDDIPTVTLPPFTLQPLVENSIVHGLRETVSGGLISISVYNDEEGGVIITIADNGIGIPEETKERALNGSLDSIGLGNTIKRLQYQYKNEDVLLFSKSGIGTTINIHLEKNNGREGVEIC